MNHHVLKIIFLCTIISTLHAMEHVENHINLHIRRSLAAELLSPFKQEDIFDEIADYAGLGGTDQLNTAIRIAQAGVLDGDVAGHQIIFGKKGSITLADGAVVELKNIELRNLHNGNFILEGTATLIVNGTTKLMYDRDTYLDNHKITILQNSHLRIGDIGIVGKFVFFGETSTLLLKPNAIIDFEDNVTFVYNYDHSLKHFCPWLIFRCQIALKELYTYLCTLADTPR
jgi:hypothetical protein